MTIVIVSLVLLGYVAIATEHITKVNKAAIAMILGIASWTLYMVAGKHYVDLMYIGEYEAFLNGMASTPSTLKKFIADHVFMSHIGDMCQIILFLFATIHIVELLNSNGCFDFIRRFIITRNSRRLLWFMAGITYLLSANLDNLTTTLLMLGVLHAILPPSSYRKYYGAVIVIAANCGGVLTVIGDVSNLMLWVKGAVTPSDFSTAMALPSIIALMIPTYLVSRKLPEKMDMISQRVQYRGDDFFLSQWQRIFMLLVGIGGIWFVPTFHNLTKLPPFVGAITVLAILYVVHELLNRKQIKNEMPYMRLVPQAMQTECMQTIIFFMGVTMTLAAISETGALHAAAAWTDEYIHNTYIVSLILGLISAVLDNVVLVLTSISMYDVSESVSYLTMKDAEYLNAFEVNGRYWQLVAYSGGVGGCLLSFGSMAGYALMKTEGVSILWYFKHITLKVLVGWLVGLGIYFLCTF